MLEERCLPEPVARPKIIQLGIIEELQMLFPSGILSYKVRKETIVQKYLFGMQAPVNHGRFEIAEFIGEPIGISIEFGRDRPLFGGRNTK
jgi:hypothetical protein